MTANPRINGLQELSNLLSTEEADRLSNAIDNQHYGKWCPEGFDRRNRVQRYSGKEMEDHFGWVFDRIVEASDQSATPLCRPLEAVITEHTPSSCRSIVNTYEQRELCPCQDQKQCQCYTATLTLVSNAIYSTEKPVGRDLECWDLVEPATNILLNQNGVVIKMGESLWEWRGRISGITDQNTAEVSSKGWKKGQKKLTSSNKRCVTLSFRMILSPDEQCSLPKQMESCTMTEETAPQPPLAELLTIIVTTSPIRSNPSTELLERTFDTFQFAGSEFAYDCPKVIVCDGCRVLEEDAGENTDSDEKKDDDPPKITRK